ncbi:hypothetical protein [Acidipropionibacterium jensenii]|uniref:hypothetical protein n=1 Tax=Acidipropionibacterium jensenii TaxID=1749 RepID=UPI00214B6B43|nr:hypothetical protein [Acidipropionibacterium jensenii]
MDDRRHGRVRITDRRGDQFAFPGAGPEQIAEWHTALDPDPHRTRPTTSPWQTVPWGALQAHRSGHSVTWSLICARNTADVRHVHSVVGLPTSAGAVVTTGVVALDLAGLLGQIYFLFIGSPYDTRTAETLVTGIVMRVFLLIIGLVIALLGIGLSLRWGEAVENNWVAPRIRRAQRRGTADVIELDDVQMQSMVSDLLGLTLGRTAGLDPVLADPTLAAVHRLTTADLGPVAQESAHDLVETLASINVLRRDTCWDIEARQAIAVALEVVGTTAVAMRRAQNMLADLEGKLADLHEDAERTRRLEASIRTSVSDIDPNILADLRTQGVLDDVLAPTLRDIGAHKGVDEKPVSDESDLR